MAKQKTLNDLHTDIVELGLKLGFKIDEQNEKFVTKEQFYETRQLLMITLEKVLVEVQAMRQEQTIHSGQHEDIDTEINGIKKRVKKIEDKQPTQHL